MMDIHHIHKWWTFIIFINHHIHKRWTPIIFELIRHPSNSLMMDIHNISYMTDIHQKWGYYSNMMGNHQLVSNSNSGPYTLLSGPSLASKPLQEHRFEYYDGASTLLTVKSFLLMQNWNFWNPVAKFDIDPKSRIQLISPYLLFTILLTRQC